SPVQMRRHENSCGSALAFSFAFIFIGFSSTAAPAIDPRGCQFIGFKSFSAFEESKTDSPLEIVLTSPPIAAHVNWDELIASWNAEMAESTYLKIEARAIYLERATKFYTMALWSGDPKWHPRESVLNQKDADGDVSTDTLMLKRPGGELQVRLTLGGDDPLKPKLKFLGLCF